MYRNGCCLVLIGALLAGCGESKPNRTDDAKSADAERKTEASQKGSLTGRWLLAASPLDQPRDIHLAVVELAKGTGKTSKLEARVLDSSETFFDGAAVDGAEASDGQISLQFAGGEGRMLNVRGRLQNGVIRGEAPTGDGVLPITLVRTGDDRVRASEPVLRDDARPFRAALQSGDPIAQLQRFAENNAESPTALAAYRQMFYRAKAADLDRKTIERLSVEFRKLSETWGPRIARMSRFEVAEALAVQGHLPELAIEILEALEKNLFPEEAAGLRVRLAITKGIAQTHRRLQLAEKHEAAGKLDAALRLYTQLAVTPGIQQQLQQQWEAEGVDRELPSEAAERLWKKTRGNTEQLESYLNTVYRELLESMPSEPTVNAARSGTRTSLLELFTGSRCPPCVAADMATSALEATYPKSAVLVLRYHQHIPGPDPLTSPDSEARFAYYRGRGTPTVFLNGRLVPNIAGPAFLAELQYEQLKEAVEPLLKADRDLTIELAAEADNGRLSLRADVTGMTDIPDTLRLRLVLAEDEVDFTAANGIRLHEMIVRAMPGGADGIGPADGKLAYAETLTLADVKRKLMEYLEIYERQSPFGGGGAVFSSKPLDLETLHLAAFVQDDETKEILQAAAVPVTGSLESGVWPVRAPVPHLPQGRPAEQGSNSPDPDGPRLIPPGQTP